jgi:hypothetical protein
MAIREIQSKVKGKVCSSVERASAELGFEKILPYAAPALQISSNPQDYVLSVIPIMYTDLPNRNGVGFPLKELVKWNITEGRQAYKTWCGAPMHLEHDADDPTTALGIIVDVALRPIRTHGNGQIWKVVALGAIDTTKTLGDEKDGIPIGQKVATGQANTYSMGAMVDGYTCSYCGAEVGRCSHIDPDFKNKPVTFYELNGRLVYKLVHGIKGVELSVVEDPAFITAISDVKMTY